MTPQEAAAVLAKAATFDNRHPDAQAALSWSQALADIPLADAIAAVVAHYAESTEWIRPGHIRARVGVVRAHRLAVAGEPELPPDLSGAEYAQALARWRRQVADGGHPDVPQLVADVTRKALSRGTG